jgi:hypothetical protein
MTTPACNRRFLCARCRSLSRPDSRVGDSVLGWLIGQAACGAQNGKGTALIGFKTEDGQTSPPSRPRTARAESTCGPP